ncbi:MAG: nitronate monooxygenase family protein [Luteibacter sp.]|uniref:NAD(P)H-dependent flavin oxidoreductase n=1 Tax=unclassified Luteibacter TaxID=2620188 RepID=UPI0005BAFC64|nr:MULTISPECIES: nitronate monooxygenase family protein [unclassified Luteibacter]MDQ7995808.1 nitronate monooxygenase family protein [Luteibacter sp.]MDQ8049096.1 nitronate monooxygenase family protein [Luteibacter sp.]
MPVWTDRRVLDLFAIEHPFLLAPMAGSGGSALAIAVARAGGLGSLPCASITADRVREEVAVFRAAVPGPINLNFFAHTAVTPTEAQTRRWLDRLAPYFSEFDVDPAKLPAAGGRAPFDAAMCSLVEELKPEVVSFHFGLPETALLDRVKATGAILLATATTVAEGRWLAERGCDAVIAQGYEAGGHRGNFLTDDMTTQPGTMALVPQMVDALSIPVIAAGGISDGRGMAAALCLGASAVQMGTAFLLSPESTSAAVHRAALRGVRDDNTVVTNVLTGRPARGAINRLMREVGPVSADAPPFPLAAGPLTPLRAATEAMAQGDFQPLWSGQAGALAREVPAEEIGRTIVAQTAAVLRLG